MLISLTVKNFAIIDNISIDFYDGMTVLTGETGAGKSLIIDALGLLFGDRASMDLIRYGEDKAIIEGVFSNYSPKINQFLENLGIDYNPEDNLSIKRELFKNGKSTCRINNNIVNLYQLAEISEYIGDIHSQNDTLGLINPKNYLNFLSSPEIDEKLIVYQQSLKDYKINLANYEKLLENARESQEKEDFLRFQYKEYIAAKINLTEEEELKKELNYLSNFEKISESLITIKEVNTNGEILENLYRIIESLKKLENFNEKYTNIRKDVEDSYYLLEASLESPELKLNDLDFDPKRVDEINSRLSIYSDFRRKYRLDTKGIIEYFNKVKKDLDLLENSEFYLDDLKKKVDYSYIKTMDIAKAISKERKVIAKQLQSDIKKHLSDLQLKKLNFEIEFKERKNFLDNGIDEVDFLISFNKGEPVKPLAKTASGGELSRFMLALKTIIGDKIPLQTKVFDEIDNGVSGSVAYSIAEKIKFISEKSQVICITHLPQVASISDHHLKISKEVVDNRTYTKITPLDKDGRIKEIAEMISKGKPTEASLALAHELLSTAANF